MYTIKAVPEDFVVEEVPVVEIKQSGAFVYFWLKKRNYTTIDAVQEVARHVRVAVERIGVAGNKDKCAVTKQLCSVSRNYEGLLRLFQHKSIQLEIAGYGESSIATGTLQGNKFRIIVRNASVVPEKREWFVNFFGEQRFSSQNVAIGRALLQQDFSQAIALMKEVRLRINSEESRDKVRVLRLLPKKVLKLFVHAYQSSLWNRVVQEVTKHAVPDAHVQVALPGFGFEGWESIRVQYEQLLEADHLSFDSFVIRQFPELSGEAQERPVWIHVPDLIISQEDKNILLTFTLPKGAYATEVVRQLFEL